MCGRHSTIAGKLTFAEVHSAAMHLALLMVTISLLTGACTTLPQPTLEARSLSYLCNDTVVVSTSRTAFSGSPGRLVFPEPGSLQPTHISSRCLEIHVSARS